ncbi:peptidoglycan-associated lipoprotein Pal [Sedimenticola hydrogenitrophicus]|uniref:peptidoglycan-associated lipoprotein Pal n=1 Tax=Sedimenticola hydrogenitrophicus TaxID=2967975 RepID=UPI0023AE79EA|nr:peptidoglycan-associated lipoprotein Pal [Sedimenticola hydrogenitrophicus]
MKLKALKFAPLLALSLLLAGCAGMTGSEQAQDGAPITEGGQDGSADGAQTSGAQEGGAWSGSPLENPDSLLYTKTIYFDYDVDEVRADYRDVVAAHGDYLAANPAVTVTIEGHADERGSREYNIALGERRANGVKRLLMAQGAAENQIITISYGEERPAAMGSGETSWELNRRAEFVY